MKQTMDWDGCIDHQSYEEYDCMEDFLQENAEGNIELFLNHSTVIICDNDNR